MNLSSFVTQESVISGYSKHLFIMLIIAIFSPIVTYFGFKKEIKIIEQILAILLIFLTIELLIYLLSFIY